MKALRSPPESWPKLGASKLFTTTLGFCQLTAFTISMRAAHKYPRKANFFSSARFRSHLEDFDVVVSGSALHKRERIWLHAMLPIPAYRGLDTRRY